jgi:hypothetical protein
MEPEVEQWLRSLSTAAFAQAAAALDLLEEEGVNLRFPHTSQLDGKLRELRFYVDGSPTRMTYFIATGRRMVLLTVFRKSQRREHAEIARATRAMEQCLERQHTAEEDD